MGWDGAGRGHAIRRGGCGGLLGAVTLGLTQEGTNHAVSGETVFQAEGAAETQSPRGDLALTRSIGGRKKGGRKEATVARAAGQRVSTVG